MPRNGSGTYIPPVNAWNPAIDGIGATAVDWQAILDDITAAMTQSVSRDGQTPQTGSQNMGGNKITNLGVAAAIGDALAWQQLFAQGTELDVVSAATTDIGVLNTNFVRITGSSTITSFGTSYRGPRFIRFDASLSLAYNATTLILPGGVNLTVAAGDSMIVVPKATVGVPDGWKVVAYQSATPIIPPGSITQTQVQDGYVDLSSAQVVAGVKTFSSTPAIPGGYVDLTNAQVIAGVKTFSSSPLAPTAAPGDNTTKLATTAFVANATGPSLSSGLVKAWVAFDSAGTIYASHNVLLVTHAGTGYWLIDTIIPFSTVNYAPGFASVPSAANDSRSTDVVSATQFELRLNVNGSAFNPAIVGRANMFAWAFGNQ